MHKFCFILGRNPELSLAELDIFFNQPKADAVTDQFAVIDLSKLDPVEAIKRLGGCVKIGQVIGSFSDLVKLENNFNNREWLNKNFPLTKNRVEFGVSGYGSGYSPSQINRLGIVLKKVLEGMGHSVRLITDKNAQLSSVSVAKNGLMSKGFELLILKDKKAVHLAITKAVQPFRDLSERDYGRPARDNHRGMLPPKLALMMINLSGVGPDDLLIDPFCGSGTVLQEAALIGIKKIQGSDIDPKAVKDAQANMDWLSKHENLEIDCKISTADATKISGQYKPDSIKAIVAEPDLGPPIPVRTIDQVRKRTEIVSQLIIKFLASASIVLNRKGRIVMVWPFWNFQGQPNYLNIFSLIPKGLRIDWPFSDWVPENNRHTMIYERPDQRVGREIVVLVKAR
ncbi:MAG: DNA methyltransferase [bacterium]